MTRNVDRIFRIPGTINHPNAKKRSLGRVACPTRLIAYNNVAHPLDVFPKHQEQTAEQPEHQDQGSDELPPMVAALLHVKGSGSYPSRSELLFTFITSALRRGVNSEVIINACLDTAYAGFGIYEHCRENGGRKYVIGQGKHARQKIKETSHHERLTDVGNAKRLVRMHGEDVRHVYLWREWLTWDNGHWRHDIDGSITRMAKETVEEMFAEAALINDPDRRRAMLLHALKSQAATRLTAMIQLASSEIEVVLQPSMLDADPNLLGVQNGVINLNTGEFRAASREDYVTKFTGVSYDPDAKCPNWNAFLKKIVTDDELIKYLGRVVGYTLTGNTVEEVMFVLHGLGANGKSTFRETIFALLGDYAVGADASMLVTNKRAGGATPDLARLNGRRLVTVNETQQNDLLNESRVKFITGHDVITARNLFKEFFDFTPTHKTFLTTNHKPIIRGTDEGIWRRIHLLPFTKTIPAEEREVNFREKMLMPELPGILNWALEGLKDYQKNGLKPPAIVTAATNEYKEDMDLLGRWMEDCCEMDEKSETPTADLHSNYEKWMEHEVGFAMSGIAFGRELANRGFEKKKKVKKVLEMYDPNAPNLRASKELLVRGFRGLHLKQSVF